MRYGVTFSHPDLGDDPGFFKEFAQSVEGAGFDHLVAAEHVIGGHPDRAHRREGAHRTTCAITSPSCCSAILGAVTERIELVTGILILPQRQTVLVAKQAPSSTCSPADASRSASASVGTGWSTRH